MTGLPSLLLLLAAAQEHPVTAEQQVNSPAVSAQASETTKLKIKKAPQKIAGDYPGTPEEARILGHHGTVVIRATVTVDGAVKNPVIETSSKSPILDAKALEAVSQWKLSPAVDAEGNNVEVSPRFPIEFANYRTPGKGGGLLRYTCKQFTTDMDWWGATHEDGIKGNELYTLQLGLRSIASGSFPTDVAVLKRLVADHEADWSNVRKKCTKVPDELMIDQSNMKKLLHKAASAEEK